ncbi:MAG: hypothetical protein H6727_19130 [Myxococcales bacterium]|nr:hypothetical protein [Myxococcales bacterium]
MSRLFATLLFVGFTAFNTWYLTQGSFWAVFPPFQDVVKTQLFGDLAVSLTLVNIWMFFDLKRHQKPMWLFVLFFLGTNLLGSMSPLLYLCLREWGVLGTFAPPSQAT